MTWRRADLDEVPEVGAEISMCQYRESDDGVMRWNRMRVEVVMPSGRVYGSGLVGVEPEWPERPEMFVGRAVFWKLYEEES